MRTLETPSSAQLRAVMRWLADRIDVEMLADVEAGSVLAETLTHSADRVGDVQLAAEFDSLARLFGGHAAYIREVNEVDADWLHVRGLL